MPGIFTDGVTGYIKDYTDRLQGVVNVPKDSGKVKRCLYKVQKHINIQI